MSQSTVSFDQRSHSACSSGALTPTASPRLEIRAVIHQRVEPLLDQLWCGLLTISSWALSTEGMGSGFLSRSPNLAQTEIGTTYADL
jgi:hypothetical protein